MMQVKLLHNRLAVKTCDICYNGLMHGLSEGLQKPFKNYYHMETFAFFYSYRYVRPGILCTSDTILREECKNSVVQI